MQQEIDVDDEVSLLERHMERVANAPAKRTRALRDACDFLAAATVDPKLKPALRAKLALIRDAYPPPDEVRRWIDADLAELPEPAMTAINELAKLMFQTEQLHHTPGKTGEARGSIDLYHPLPDEYQKSRHMDPKWTVRRWLRPEDHITRFRLVRKDLPPDLFE
jgi:hypothetical protein